MEGYLDNKSIAMFWCTCKLVTHLIHAALCITLSPTQSKRFVENQSMKDSITSKLLSPYRQLSLHFIDSTYLTEVMVRDINKVYMTNVEGIALEHVQCVQIDEYDSAIPLNLRDIKSLTLESFEPIPSQQIPLNQLHGIQHLSLTNIVLYTPDLRCCALQGLVTLKLERTFEVVIISHFPMLKSLLSKTYQI